jgi:hypothetical protein
MKEELLHSQLKEELIALTTDRGITALTTEIRTYCTQNL